MRQFLLLVVACIGCALVLGGCSRSPAEQLAYQHAEDQYQINIARSERYRQSLRDGDDNEVSDSNERNDRSSAQTMIVTRSQKAGL